MLVCAFKGWNDAGEAASAAVGFIHEHFDCATVAEIDPEEFYDFTAVRPTVKLTEGDAARSSGRRTRSPARRSGRRGDLVMLQGVEPSLRWRRFSENVVETAQELDVRMVMTLGALLADVPHTRPVSITGIAHDQTPRRAARLRAHELRGPDRHRRRAAPRLLGAGLPSASLWASVPHYVAAAPNPKVALALVRAFEGAAGVAVDAGELEEAAEDYERQVNAAVASDPEVKAFVERLESAMDEVEADGTSEDQHPLGRHDRARLPALPAPARPEDCLDASQPSTGASPRPPLLLLRRRADDPVVAEAADLGRRRRLEVLRRIPSPISATVARTRSSSSSRVLDRHLLAGQHVVVALRRGLEPPGLARAHLVERQLDVLAQVVPRSSPCRSCSRSARRCRRAGGRRGRRGRAAGAGRA